MAKSQKRSSREVRKPKANKDKAAAPVPIGLNGPASPVHSLMQKPKAKL